MNREGNSRCIVSVKTKIRLIWLLNMTFPTTIESALSDSILSFVNAKRNCHIHFFWLLFTEHAAQLQPQTSIQDDMKSSQKEVNILILEVKIVLRLAVQELTRISQNYVRRKTRIFVTSSSKNTVYILKYTQSYVYFKIYIKNSHYKLYNGKNRTLKVWRQTV